MSEIWNISLVPTPSNNDSTNSSVVSPLGLGCQTNSLYSIMSSSLDARIESGTPIDTLHAAPEGLPKFRKLLDQSAKIDRQLSNRQYGYLRDLAQAWEILESSLKDVCVDIKQTSESTTEDGLRTRDILESEPTGNLLLVFAQDPVEPMSSKKLLPEYEEAISMLPDPKDLRSDLDIFWDLWRPARDEIEEHGRKVQDRYEPFFLANISLNSSNRKGEGDIFGDITLSFEDAKTIDACLPEPNPQHTGSYESESAEVLLEYIRTTACQGHKWADLRAGGQEGNESPLAPSVGSDSLMAPEISDSDLKGLDITMFVQYVTPKLRKADAQLVRSLRNARAKYATQASQVRPNSGDQPLEARKANALYTTAQLLETLAGAVEYSLSNQSSHSQAPSLTATAGNTMRSTT